ncbi:hypothetical protein IV102_35030 [bacterium]|nr:hypothetical protein [bacterium]
MSYTFRLKGLLKLVEQERDLRLREVQQVESYLELALAEIRLIWEEMERSQNYFEDLAQRSPCTLALGQTLRHFQSQRDTLKNLLRLKLQLEEELSKRNADLVTARRNVRRLEMLRERQLEQYQLDALAKQQAGLDEFAIQQFNRRS